jgi:hypothetical protein
MNEFIEVFLIVFGICATCVILTGTGIFCANKIMSLDRVKGAESLRLRYITSLIFICTLSTALLITAIIVYGDKGSDRESNQTPTPTEQASTDPLVQMFIDTYAQHEPLILAMYNNEGIGVKIP